MKWWGSILVVVALAAGCATVPTGDTKPSVANESLGGPRTDDPSSDMGNRSWGIDLLSGYRTWQGR
jgi:hypothetical protein